MSFFSEDSFDGLDGTYGDTEVMDSDGFLTESDDMFKMSEDGFDGTFSGVRFYD